jgi:hypothetical protein
VGHLPPGSPLPYVGAGSRASVEFPDYPAQLVVGPISFCLRLRAVDALQRISPYPPRDQCGTSALEDHTESMFNDAETALDVGCWDGAPGGAWTRPATPGAAPTAAAPAFEALTLNTPWHWRRTPSAR